MATYENYSVNQFHDAAWLCYINGIEIPTMAVSTHFAVWQFPTATITLVPHPMLQRIGAEDRLQVVLFWLDTFWDPKDPQFRLFGEFEVTGSSYSNTPRGRSFQLQCVGHAHIFQQLNFFYVSSINDIAESAVGQVPTDPATMSFTKLFYPTCLFLEGLAVPPAALDELAAGADTNLVDEAKNSPASQQETMVEVQRVDSSDGSTYFVTMTEAAAIAEGYTANGTGANGYTVVQESAAVQSAAASQAYFDNFDLSSVIKKTGGEGFIKRPIDFVFNIFRTLNAVYNTNPDPNAEIPQGQLPAAAVGCPGRNFFGRWLQTTRFDKRWVALPKFENSSGFSGCFPLVQAVMDTQTLAALSEQIGRGVGFSGSAWDLLQQVLGYMYEEVATLPAPPAVSTKTTGDIVSHVRQSGEGLEKRIATHYVKPQCTFALPPVCNIIFPSMIKQYTFQENYITQPTRIYLGDDFISKAIGDQSGNMSGVTKRLLTTGYPLQVRHFLDAVNQSAGSNNKNFLIYPEEMFKGPVTTQFNAPPWMYMLSQQEKASGDDQIKPTVAAGEEQPTAQETALANAAEVGVEKQIVSTLGSIFDKYAEYEFYRARYAERGGGLSVLFNPFLVPGFPIAIFDQKYSGFNTMGYVNSLDHNWVAGGGSPAMDTEVGLTFIRTMPEFMSILADPNAVKASGKMPADMAPTEVIPGVAAILQFFDPANDFYSKLLFCNQKIPKPAIFNWKSMVTMRKFDGTKIDPKSDTDMSKCSQDMSIIPREPYVSLFDNYDAAMSFVSRPACTLSEYVEIYHGKTVAELKSSKVLKGESRSFYGTVKDPKNKQGAIFWAEIYQLRQGPGSDPGVSVTNVAVKTTDPITYAPGSTETGSWAQTSNLPETRKDWASVLKAYRKIVRSEGGYIAPQY